MKKLRIIFGLALAVLLIAGPVFAADQTIAATEEMVGSGHATKTDTLNRLGLVGHETDGTHKTTISTTGGTLTIDETASLSAKAPKASPTFTGNVTLSGAVTNATLPSFSVRPTANQENIALNSAVTVVFGTEVFDLANNFATNTFTAPVTGKYQLNVTLVLNSIDSAATSYDMYLLTSNRDFYHSIDPRVWASDPVTWSFSWAELTDMDAGDTASVLIYQTAGTQQTDVVTYSQFSGFLVN
ncbi:MAG: hypothetical protein ABIH23_07810 [bacterium]